MPRATWAVDLGDWSLKVVRGISTGRTGTITVDLFDEIVYGTLPCGFEAGPLERQREGLLAFRRKYEVEPGDDLCLSVTGSEVFSRFINLPPVPESIGDIIRYEARQQIPFDIDEVVWDYQPVKEEHELGEEIEVGLFALKKDRVDELMDLLDTWRKNLRVIQDAPLAVYNFLEYEGYCDIPIIVADIGSSTSDLLVLNPPRFWLRTLLVAGDDLTKTLMQKFNIGPAEAERMKRRLGRSEHRARVLKMFRPMIDDLSNEIQRSLGYYKSLAREVRFERMLLLGSALKLEGLPEMIGRGLQYDVEMVSELRNMKLADSVDEARFNEALPGNCAALGLLVQGCQRGRMRVNLVPDEVALAGEMNKKKPWAVCAAVLIMIAVGILIAAERLHVGPLDRTLAGIRAATKLSNGKDLLTVVKKDRDDYQREEKNITGRISALKTATEPAVDGNLFLHILPVLTKVVPKERIYLTRVSFSWWDERRVSRWQSDTGERSDEADPFAAEVEERWAPEEDIEAAVGGEEGTETKPKAPLGPLRGPDSQLVMLIEGESLITDHDLIEEKVIEALRKATYTQLDTEDAKEKPKRPLFTVVRKLSIIDVIEEAAGEADLAEDALAGIARRTEAKSLFRAFAVVNTNRAYSTELAGNRSAEDQ